ncbi:MAG: PIN domain-containing protein [Nanoarchaeota archaeon]
MKSSKKYIDSDFFLALMKDSDWLKQKARNLYKKHKQSLYITPFTIAEIMIVCIREDIPLRETLSQISRIAKLDSFSWNVFFDSCDYIEQGATLFDSLLMSFCGKENSIISSDKVYKKFGFNIIDLKK